MGDNGILSCRVGTRSDASIRSETLVHRSFRVDLGELEINEDSEMTLVLCCRMLR